MTEIRPFRAIHYDGSKHRGQDVTAPPYDILTPELRTALYEKSPYNIVRIDSGLDQPGDGPSGNKYTRARRLMEDWLGEGVLLRDTEPCYYAYRMAFQHSGKRLSLTGLFALVGLVELGKGVYPHESTHSKPKHDRMMLLSESGANTSPIYSLYRARDKAVSEVLARATAGKPYMQSVEAEGTEHSLWIIKDASDVQAITRSVSGCPIYIADGHHRYETAWEYHKQARAASAGAACPPQPSDYVLMFLADMAEPDLVILPTHRLITVDTSDLLARLSENFSVQALPPGADIVAAMKGMKRVFGLYLEGGSRYLLTCKECGLGDVHDVLKRLDVVVLHKLVFGRLLEVGNWGYEMDYKKSLEMVDKGEYDAALFLNPTEVGDVEAVAAAHLRMPPKSTFFFPKVQTGFVINTLKSF